MANVRLAGTVLTGAAAAVVGATVELLDRDTTTPVRATFTGGTDANGDWNFSYAPGANSRRVDVRVTNGTSISFLKQDDEIQVASVETEALRILNPNFDFEYDIVPAAITAARQLNLPLITATRTLIANDTPIADDAIILLGTDSDIALLNRSTTLAANTALTGVLVGIPVTPALAANSLIVSNVTASGDILLAGNLGGNSRAYLFADVSADTLDLMTVGVSRILLGAGGNVFIGDTSNANTTQGLTINQGAADNQILALKSSDINHGMSTESEVDTFAFMQKVNALEGGVVLRAFSTTLTGIQLHTSPTTESTARTVNANGPIEFQSDLRSGATIGNMAANVNIIVIRAQQAGSLATRFILDTDGDSHQDVGTAWTNFDEYDDLALMRAVQIGVTRKTDPLRQQFLGQIEQSRSWLQSLPGKPIVTFNEDGHHFVNTSRLAMLHHGAIMQLGNYYQSHEERLEYLEAENNALRQEVRALRGGGLQ